MHNQGRRRALCLLACAGVAGGMSREVLADFGQNAAVNATYIDLFLGNLANTSGAGVSIGVIEAGDNIPNYSGLNTPGSLLPNGNPWLPAARFTALAQGGVFGAADTPGNHASTVAGVIVSSHATEPGIAPGANLIVAGTSNVASVIKNTEAAYQAGARIMNYSFGFRRGPGNNNGNSTDSLWMDYAARTFAGAPIQDVLFVVAGNETPDGVNDFGSPSDGYNCINVGATGRASAGGVAYDKQAPYNRTNTTSDLSPITGFGRVKTDIVAPGGDPVAATGFDTVNHIGTAGFGPVGSFYGTSGGQLTNIGPIANPAPPPASFAAYAGDDWNRDGLVEDAFSIVDNDPARIAAPGPASNPGFGTFGGNDIIAFNGTAGTSFAAPLVSGAAALLRERGGQLGLSTDHRVLKAVMLNGADKNITDKNGAAWGRLAVGAVTKPDNVNGGNVQLKVGLDPLLGTGQLDMIQTGLNYTAGQHGPGITPPVGWDLNSIGATSKLSYYFTEITQMTATLCWDRIVSANNLGGDNLYSAATTTFTNSGLTDLDLLLYELQPNGDSLLIDLSTSDIDNVEHIWNLSLPLGDYRLDVVNQGNRFDSYALAWRTVPEPMAGSLLALLGVAAARRRRNRV